MLSIRAFARAVPRRTFKSSIPTLRPLSTIRKPTFLQSSFTSLRKHSYPAFSTSSIRKEPAGESDLELSAKIEQELRLERESRDQSQVPASVQEYMTNGPFKIEDTPGSEEIVLTRKFGDETIKVTFSIADINGIDEDAAQLDDDTALDDEDMAMGDDMLSARSNQSINQSNKTGAVDVMPEDSVAPAEGAAQGEDDGAMEDDDQMPPAYPIRLNITIIKPSKGAVQVDALARDGLIEVQDVFYFPNADIAIPATPEKMHARQNVYAGPPFSNLDNELQSMLERYLDERGINPQLASFVPDYSDYKEQKEYVGWLGNMKSFIDA